jgi:ribose-phosphate pyrophosphokinase
MRAYTLPDPDAGERDLLKALAGDSRQRARWTSFPNGEDRLRVEDVERDVCVIGRTAPPGDNLFRTLLLIDTLRRSGAERITLALPYFGYGRQDRQQLSGESVTASAVIAALAAAGASRVVTADLHSDLVRETSPVPIESVSPVVDMAEVLRKVLGDELCTVVAPDHGARHRADLLAAGLGQRQEAAWVDKSRHPLTGKIDASEIRGPVQGTIAVLIDDILDSGKTIELAVRLLRRRSFKTIFLCVTHGLFDGDAQARIRRLKLKNIFVTDALPLKKYVARLPGLKVVRFGRRLAAKIKE